jgi:hypothetical protein
VSEQLSLPLVFDRWPVIYVLCDRRDGEVRYVGSTRLYPPIRRLESHRHRYAARRVRRWVAEIGATNVSLEVLDTVPPEDRHLWEQAYLDAFREAGANLLNVQRTVRPTDW